MRALPGSIIDCTPKAWPDGEQAADEAGHQVLARTRGHDGVVGPWTHEHSAESPLAERQ